MLLRGRGPLVALLAGLGVVLGGQAAFATTTYTDVIGTNVSYTGIQETSTTDPEPLFDQPVGLGDQLLFFPPAFLAESIDGGIDTTNSQLQLMFESTNDAFFIEALNLTEFGDINLTAFPPPGPGALGVSLGLGGIVTVLEDINGPITPVEIPFTATYNPGLDATGFRFGSDGLGLVTWSASVSVDIAAEVPFATKAFLSLDNNLTASSGPDSSSLIQKKVVDGPAVVIEVVPEPGTFFLVGGGLLGLALAGRGRRHR